MAKRSEIVALFEQDMRGFLKFMKLSQRKFCKRFRLNNSLFANLHTDKHSPTIEMMERCYDDMDAEGFISERRKNEMLIHEARAGNLTEVMALAQQLADETHGHS